MRKGYLIDFDLHPRMAGPFATPPDVIGRSYSTSWLEDEATLYATEGDARRWIAAWGLEDAVRPRFYEDGKGLKKLTADFAATQPPTGERGGEG